MQTYHQLWTLLRCPDQVIRRDRTHSRSSLKSVVSRRKMSFYLIASRAVLLVAFVGAMVGAQAQSNLLNNFSFENFGAFPIPDWGSSECCLLGHINEPGAAADGGNYVSILAGGSVWQDVQTIPDRSYIVRFAVSVFNSKVRVLCGGAVIGEVNFTNVPGQGQWFYTNFTSATATSTVTRFEFQGVLGSSDLDAVSVGWREEPPSIITQVPSRSSFEGGTVTFPVVPSGGPPLAYQWYFNDVGIIAATNRVLTLTNAQKQDEGSYWVRITNNFGQTASLPATLITQPIPQLPLIVDQPKSQQTTAGYFASFYVFAVGSPPLRYKWRFNVTNDIPGATNAHFSIPAVAQSDAGDYSVLVSNASGDTLSIPATLAVATGFGGGVVIADNLNSPVDAPIFDVDGTTRLSGSDYWAQIYSGATSNSLHAVGSPVPFWTDDLAGYYFTSGATSIPDVPAGQVAYVQVRAWDHRFGETFEEARALGGKFGKSAT